MLSLEEKFSFNNSDSAVIERNYENNTIFKQLKKTQSGSRARMPKSVAERNLNWAEERPNIKFWAE